MFCTSIAKLIFWAELTVARCLGFSYERNVCSGAGLAFYAKPPEIEQRAQSDALNAGHILALGWLCEQWVPMPFFTSQFKCKHMHTCARLMARLEV